MVDMAPSGSGQPSTTWPPAPTDPVFQTPINPESDDFDAEAGQVGLDPELSQPPD